MMSFKLWMNYLSLMKQLIRLLDVVIHKCWNNRGDIMCIVLVLFVKPYISSLRDYLRRKRLSLLSFEEAMKKRESDKFSMS